MGREIRRVPAGWEHPKDSKGHHQPLFDRDYETSMRDWYDELQKWFDGEFVRVMKDNPNLKYQPSAPFTAFKDWHGEPPDPKYHRPCWTPEEMTHYQVYENVSEGTPLSPVFAALDEIVEHLVVHGDDWDRPVSREAAEAFVKSGYAPSMVISSMGITTGIESLRRDV